MQDIGRARSGGRPAHQEAAAGRELAQMVGVRLRKLVDGGGVEGDEIDLRDGGHNCKRGRDEGVYEARGTDEGGGARG